MIGLAGALSIEAFNLHVENLEIKEKQLLEARELVLKAKEFDPGNPRIYQTLSEYALLHGDPTEGIRLAEAALTLDPKNPDRYTNLSNAYAFVLEDRKAIDLLTQAIRLDPKNVDEDVLFNMGLAHFRLGNDAAAIDWLRKAADSNPNSPHPLATLAMAYSRSGDQSRARAAVAALLRVDPKFRMSAIQAQITGLPAIYQKYWETTLLPVGRQAGLPE
jgi:adenylate cyclase